MSTLFQSHSQTIQPNSLGMRLPTTSKAGDGDIAASQGLLTRRQEEKLVILGRDEPPLTVILVNTWVNANTR